MSNFRGVSEGTFQGVKAYRAAVPNHVNRAIYNQGELGNGTRSTKFRYGGSRTVTKA